MFSFNFVKRAPLHDDGVLLGGVVLTVVGVVTIGHLVSLLGVQPVRSYIEFGPAPSSNWSITEIGTPLSPAK